jgi:predicted short-subunit dehydrogenase-like oxidoreductase (DUF2520 family)
MESTTNPESLPRIVIVGGGRLGRALARVLREAGAEVAGPYGRGEMPRAIDSSAVVLLTVPDDAIARVAATVPEGPMLGHCSGALTLDVLGARDGFSMHPLLSVTDATTSFAGAACAVAGRSSRAIATAQAIAERAHMEPVEVPDGARPSYHAAASVASNYLVTLEDAAEQLARGTGVERRHLARLAQSALDNWVRLGGRDALTGPIVRGDETTVERQRAATASVAPDLLPLWDALVDATRTLAARPPHSGA